jgi:uncharacterized protein involved in tellurium resistance
MTRYLTITAAAKYKHTTRQTIYNAIYRGQIDTDKSAGVQLVKKNKKLEKFTPQQNRKKEEKK